MFARGGLAFFAEEKKKGGRKGSTSKEGQRGD